MKARVLYSLAILATVVLGLSTRMFSASMPSFVALHFGDALWAAMVYFGCRFLFPAKPLLLALCLSLAFSYLIEFSQLYQADWINHIRSSTLGALVLGRGFLWIDLLRYLAGVLIAFLTDVYLSRSTKTISKQY